MDPSRFLSSDHGPHPPQQHFYPFAPFPTPAAIGAPSVTNSAVSGTSAAAATTNHHAAAAPIQALPSHNIPSNHPPYVDMICMAIAGLNEPEGSSKQAISRFIDRVYSGLTPAHDALLTHHLNCLKNNGVLVMVQNSYKFSTSPPSSTALEASRFDLLITTDDQKRNLSDSNGLPQKRGRGRPPKVKPESQSLGTQPKAADCVVVQPNLQDGSNPGQDQPKFSVSEPGQSETPVAKRGRGRPRKNGAQLVAQTAPVNALMKHRERPLGGRSPGRPRKPKSVTAPAMVFPYAPNVARRRGRPKRAESVVGALAVAEGGAVVSSSKRRGRPPKIDVVVGKPMKSLSRTGRPVGRPRKNAIRNNAAYGDLMRKLGIFQETIKQVIGILKAGMGSENQVVNSAIRELEGLVAMDSDDAVVPAEEIRMPSQSEADEVAGGRAEAMQEALF